MTASLPDLLLPYQQEAIALSAQHDLLVVEKSRRTGMTYGFAADAVLTAAPAHGGMDFFYIAYNLDMTREFIGYVGEFAKAFDQLGTPSEFLFDDGSEAGIKALRVDFPSGHAVVALSSKPRSLRGKQGKLLVDEAAFHDELAELLKAGVAFLMWGGSIVVVSTHDGTDNPFNELIEEIRAKRREGAVMRLTLQEALDQGLYKRICLRGGKTWSVEAQAEWERKLRATYGDAATEELDVVPSRGSGAYLLRTTIEAAMAPADSPAHVVLRLTPAEGFERRPLEDRQAWLDDWFDEHVAPHIDALDPVAASFWGQDFARSGDLSVVAIGQFDALATLHARIVIEMRAVPFRQQKQLLDRLCDALPRFSAAKMDARGNGQQLAEDMGDDWGRDRVEGVMASPKSYLAMMPRLKARIEDRTLIMPRSTDILDDLRLIKLTNGVPSIRDRTSGKEDGAKGQRHGDSAVALMHLVAAADEDVGPFELSSTGARPSSAANPGARGSFYDKIMPAAANGGSASYDLPGGGRY